MSSAPRYTMVVNPDSVRWSHYERELQEFWRLRGASPSIDVLDWRTLIACDGRIDSLSDNPLSDKPSVLRIGSPARGSDVTRSLLQAGQRSRGIVPTAWDSTLPGWLASPGLVYEGFAAVLRGLGKSLSRRPWHAGAAEQCRNIEWMFDKNRTSEILDRAELPCPEWFRPPDTIAALQNDLERRRWRTAYVKLAYGSCASGIVRLTNDSGTLRGVTTVAQIEGRFHNTRLVRSLEGAGLTAVLEFLLAEGATVQRAIPKARVDGENFDVRLVVVRGRVIASIFRASPHPMTNLHLGGSRADPQRCRAVLSPRHWLDALDDSCAAAELFGLTSIGVDVAFDRNTGRPYILELNAFGDFFPNWTDARGRTIHQMEIESTAQAQGWI